MFFVEEQVAFGHADFATEKSLESSKKTSRLSLISSAESTSAPLSTQPTEGRVLWVAWRTIFPPPRSCLASAYSWCISLSAPRIRGSEKTITKPMWWNTCKNGPSLASWAVPREAQQHDVVGRNSSEARYSQPTTQGQRELDSVRLHE